MITDYYDIFCLQKWATVSDGFGGEKWRWSDDIQFEGIYIQRQSDDARLAEAQGMSSIGDFVTGITVPLAKDDIIRRVSDNIYFRITGIPVKAPVPAMSKIQRMSAEMTVIEQ
jgi:hypothetical protein